MKKSKILFQIIVIGILNLVSADFVFAIPAMQQRCEPNLSCIIGEYVFDDDGHTPIATDNYCKITITNPSDTVIVNAENMPDKNDGWYYYSTSTLASPEGLYRSKICCDVGGTEELCIDKSFILGTSFDTLPEKVWTYSSRTLTAFGSLAADIWNDTYAAARKLTSRQIGSGDEYIAGVTTSTTVAQVANEADQTTTKYNVELIRGATFDFAGFADSGSSSSTLVDAELTQPDDYWNNYRLIMMSGANFGEERTVSDFVAASDTLTVSSAFTNAIASGDKYVLYHETRLVYQIWNYTTRTLTSFGTLVSDIWSNSTRTLTGFGSLAADIWNDTFAPTRRLTDETLTGGGKIATQTDITNATTTLIAEINENQALIAALNNISAANVWSYATRGLTEDVDLTTTSTLAIWNQATSTLTSIGSIGKLLVDNINATISSRGTSNLTAADVWLAATRTLTDYATSSIATTIWNDATRTLTNYGNDITAANVWNVLLSSLTSAGSVGKAIADNRIVHIMADGEILAGSGTDNYRVKVYIYNLETQLVNASTTPTVTIYNPSRAAFITDANMTSSSTGIYEYVTTIGAGSSSGRWETIVTVNTGGTNPIKTSGYFEVEASPARVTINSITDNTVPSITANFAIANEGTLGYEYHYKYCVVDTIENVCDGINEIAWGQGAEYIESGVEEQFNKTLTVNNTGTYIYKVVVYWGTEKSVAALQFDAVAESTPPSGGGGGGGGGGGVLPPTTTPVACSGADFNHDSIVNSVDFSILLYFWKTQSPFRNECVDINKDARVNSVDFSILLYQWGKPGVNIK